MQAPFNHDEDAKLIPILIIPLKLQMISREARKPLNTDL